MENIIVILILALVTFSVVWYLIRSKRKGNKCIGCPYANQCEGSCQNKTKNREV